MYSAAIDNNAPGNNAIHGIVYDNKLLCRDTKLTEDALPDINSDNRYMEGGEGPDSVFGFYLCLSPIHPHTPTLSHSELFA